MEVVQSTLHRFCEASGEKVNLNKTQLYFSANVRHDIRMQLADLAGFSVTTDLENYLGVPILHAKSSRNKFDFLIERVSRHLSGWQSKLLSLAGRITLTKSILNTIPAFVMQTIKLPSSVCLELDRIMRRFIWGSTETRRKLSLANWDLVSSLKNLGGLGIRPIQRFNKAFLMKLAFQFITKQDSLWVRLLRDKYIPPSYRSGSHLPGHDGSIIWRGIKSVWYLTRGGCATLIRNGRNTDFWRDNWVEDDKPLIEYLSEEDRPSINPVMVAEFANADGKWKWDKFASLLPNSTCLRIASLLPPRQSAESDRLYWCSSRDGKCTVKSAYNSLLPDNITSSHTIWSVIWKWGDPERIRTFLWLACNNRLLTNMARFKRNLSSSGQCPLGCPSDESVLHVLRDCSVAKVLWNDLGVKMIQSGFFQVGILDWFESNLRCTYVLSSLPWTIIFGVTC
ncbi:PREDICTED: uncharacterized protein LOC104799794 [Tarenaya hassleriana]|uniref:uncharacterized protein LOC104799794 n=1 Tax=Tarenaya hassleriana TaxID=28532 RepID=UPI00053C373D|nr:PREDICTED: uncharacterized protein LOC104799794 [Tarenaya hassleriana]